MSDEAITESVDALIDSFPSPHSRRGFRLEWDKYTAWLKEQNVPVLAAKPKTISAYLSALKTQGLAKATIHRARNIILNIYSGLVRDELLRTNPAREVKVARMSADPRTPVLTEEQLAALLGVSNNTWHGRRARLCIQLLGGLGWRRAEIARIRTGDLKDHTITGIIKGGKEVTVGVPLWLWVEIDRWREFAGIGEDAALLPRSPKNRQAVSDNIVYKIVKDAAKEVGLPKETVTPHAIRRTFITILREKGTDLKVLQLAVGHSNQSTTERYDKARNAAKNAPGQVFENLIEKANR